MDDDIAAQDENEKAPEKSKKLGLGISVGRLIRDAEGRVIGFSSPESDAEHDASSTSRGEPSSEAMNARLVKGKETPWGAPMAEDRPVAPVVAKTPVVQGELS